MHIPRSVKNAMRTIKTYCKKQPNCFQCDVCYLLRNISPVDWEIEELELETECEYKSKCSEFINLNNRVSELSSELAKTRLRAFYLEVELEKYKKEVPMIENT